MLGFIKCRYSLLLDLSGFWVFLTIFYIYKKYEFSGPRMLSQWLGGEVWSHRPCGQILGKTMYALEFASNMIFSIAKKGNMSF